MPHARDLRGRSLIRYGTAALTSALVIVGVAPAQAAQAAPQPDVAGTWLTQTIAANDTATGFGLDGFRMGAIGWLSAQRALDGGPDNPLPAGEQPHFQEAAVATAVHDALVALAPARKEALDTALTSSLDAIPDGAGEQAGIEAGQQATARLLREREGDGFDSASLNKPFTPPPPAPGVYRLPPGATATALAGLGEARPFLLGRADRFRPGPSPAIGTETYRRDLKEIQKFGSATTKRTPTQTETMRLWHASPFKAYSAALVPLVADTTRPLTWKVGLLAAFTTATLDAQIAVSDAKFTYLRWRPITAIREADTDGDPLTQPDKTWNPTLTTPPGPEYPGATVGYAGAAERVLERFAGSTAPMSFTVSVTTSTGEVISRQYPRGTPWSALTRENVDSRIYSGAHFRTSSNVAAQLARRVADYNMKQLAHTS